MVKLDAARERVAKVTGQTPTVTLCYFERHTAIIERREKIKKLTIQNRRLNHQRQAA